MKKIILSIAAAVFMISCGNAETKTFRLTVSNPYSTDRVEEMVEIPLADIQQAVGDTKELVVLRDGIEIPSQITYDGKLIFQPEVSAGQTVDFEIKTGKPAKYEARTYGRHIVERKDDFAWENDKVAFRIYGPALKSIDGPSNGIDTWYKCTDKMIIDKFYENDIAGIASYHEDHGEGLDDYKVGRSLGAGAMAPYIDGKLILNENYARQQLHENGPLRTTFTVEYNDIDINGNPVTESRTFSIDAGSNFTKIIQEYGVDEPIEVAAGIVKRAADDYISGGNYIIYAEPVSPVVDEVFLALVFPDGMKNHGIDTYFNEGPKNRGEYSHIIGVADYQPGKPVTYYTGFGWSKWGFDGLESYEKYVSEFAGSLEKPLVVEYNN